MRCLHCGKRLALFRKFTDAEFCSDEHRQAYSREQEQLALSRLIDAQQQSQQVVTRRKEKKKAVPPPLELSSERLGAFARLEPEMVEASWRGCQKDEVDPAFAEPLVTLPRMEALVRSHRVPAPGPVAGHVLAGASGAAGVAVTVEPVAAPEQATALTLPALGALTGTACALEESPAFDAADEPLAEACAPAETPARIPEAGIVTWAVAIRVARGAFPWRPVAAKPVALRSGWIPDTLPNAGLRVIAVETKRSPKLRFERAGWLLPVAPPASRKSTPERRSAAVEPEPFGGPSIPAGPEKPAPLLRAGGCTPLDLGQLAVGKRERIDVIESAMSGGLACVLPTERRPDPNSGLRWAAQRPIHIPQANWGWQLVGVGESPEPRPAFLVPPRATGLSRIEFTPPPPGLLRLRLHPKYAVEPGERSVQCTEGPLLPAPRPGARPGFSCPPLCDWVCDGVVQAQARMMPLPFVIEPRGLAHTAEAGAWEPEEAGLGEAAPVAMPACALEAAGQPRFRDAGGTMRRLSVEGMAPRQAAQEPKGLLEDEPIAGLRVLPASRLRLAKDRPTLEIERRLSAPAWRKSLYWAADTWRSLPVTARLTAFAALALAGALAATPKAGPGDPAGFQASIERSWQGVQRNILRRAAVALTDDFRTGLADWEGKGDWARAWSYDQAGFVRTGPMALYTPSLKLTDYRMEFLGQIEKRSLGWIVRAADAANYQALKLTVTEPGPVPAVVLQRYVVIGGKAGPVSSKRLPMQVRMDTMYRAQVDVRGAGFAVTVQDQIVDSWEEPRLPRGGVGFFSGNGEQARLRWVGVWHQYDTLGRLCALLAPAGIADRDTGASQ